MQDRAVAEAIVAGDPDGIAGAYDRYAASLHAYCRSMLAEPEATEALLDTFIVAAARLDALADPGRLEAWLLAVARNECLRRRGSGGTPAAAGRAVTGLADPDDEFPAVTLPVELRGMVLAACTDTSPAGRARRMSVVHHAGPFGPTGFPRAAHAAASPWWRRVRRHPRVAAAAVLAAVAVSAGITVVMTVGDAHHPHVSALGLVGGASAGSAPGGTSAAPSSARRTSPAASRPASQVTRPPVTSSARSSAGPRTPTSPARPGRPVSPSSSPPPSPPPSPSPSPPPSPSPSPSASPSASPSQGSLLVAPAKLVLTSVSGKPVSGSFLLTAAGGPVSAYAIKVPAAVAGRVVVWPARGSLAAGAFVKVTVTVTSKTVFTTVLTVAPGNVTVQVTYKF